MEAGVTSKCTEIFVSSRVDAVLGMEGKSRFQVSDGRVRVPL